MEEAVKSKFQIVGGDNLCIEKEEEVFSTTYWKNTKRKILKNKVIIIAFGILIIIVAIAIIGP